VKNPVFSGTGHPGHKSANKLQIRNEYMKCTACMREIPEESRYCMYCGTFLEKDSSEEGFDGFEDRIPCSDGTCIGTIENGRCTVCGKPYSEEPQ
jgi:hypothetical protein